MIVTHTPITRYTIGYDIYSPETPFVLNSDIHFCVLNEDWGSKKFTVPEDFRSDGATITLKLAKLIIGCEHNPLFFPAVIAHDYMCQHKSNFKRNFASKVMLELLLKRDVPNWKAYLMYYCVELYMKYWEGWE